MQTTEIFESSVFFGVFISLASYTFGVWLKKTHRMGTRQSPAGRNCTCRRYAFTAWNQL